MSGRPIDPCASGAIPGPTFWKETAYVSIPEPTPLTSGGPGILPTIARYSGSACYLETMRCGFQADIPAHPCRQCCDRDRSTIISKQGGCYGAELEAGGGSCLKRLFGDRLAEGVHTKEGREAEVGSWKHRSPDLYIVVVGSEGSS